MDELERVRKVSESPTRPPAGSDARPFDVADLYRGPLATGASAAAAPEEPLEEKARRAYWWITNHAIISPFYDIEYRGATPLDVTFGDSKVRLTLPSEQSYSSYVLLPLLNLVVRGRCLLVGGPGRGKTAIAVLRGLLAGDSL
jgi:hypothetical protein